MDAILSTIDEFANLDLFSKVVPGWSQDSKLTKAPERDAREEWNQRRRRFATGTCDPWEEQFPFQSRLGPRSWMRQPVASLTNAAAVSEITSQLVEWRSLTLL
jgi:hypothetical protein